MSYINNALRKLQKEEKTRYEAYDHYVSAPGKTSKASKKWLLIIGISMVFFIAAGMIVFLYEDEDEKIPEMQRTLVPPALSTASVTPPFAPTFPETPPSAPAVATPPPAPAASVTPKQDKTVEAGQNEKTAKVKTAQKIAESKALYAQALQRHRKGKFEEAKKLYRKVVEFEQYNVQAFNNLGVIYMGEKNYRRAIMRFNDALNIKQDYVDAHYNLACLYAQNNDVNQSLLYLKNAIEFNPEVRQWAKNDSDLTALANLPEFKKLMEKQLN